MKEASEIVGGRTGLLHVGTGLHGRIRALQPIELACNFVEDVQGFSLAPVAPNLLEYLKCNLCIRTRLFEIPTQYCEIRLFYLISGEKEIRTDPVKDRFRPDSVPASIDVIVLLLAGQG